MTWLRRLSLVLLVLVLGLLVTNVFQTRERNRINSIEATSHTVAIYPSGVTRTAQEVLDYFQALSQKYQVSIVKTDLDGNRVVKSALVNQTTFPLENIGVTSLDFGQAGNQVYANFDVDHKAGQVATFLQAKEVLFQSLTHYFKDSSHSVNGTYRIVSTADFDQEALLADLSDFFGISVADLTQERSHSVEGLVNQEVILLGLILMIGVIFLVISTVYQPLLSLKEIGVKKLLGFSSASILAESAWPDVALLLGSSLTIDLFVGLFLANKPQGYFLALVLGQLSFLLFYSLLLVGIFSIIQSIHLSHLLKGFLDFRLAIYVNYGIKALFLALVAASFALVSQTISDMATAQREQALWQEQGEQLITIENYRLSVGLQNALVNNPQESYAFFSSLYHELEDKAGAYYLRSERLALDGSLPSLANQTEAQVMYVNQNYLTSLGLTVTASQASQKTFFLPKSLEKDASAKTFVQYLSCRLLSYEEQEKTDYQQLAVNLVYYDQEVNPFPFIEGEAEPFHNPIFSLVGEELAYEEAAYLTNTGISSPLKVPNTKANRQKLTQLETLATDGTVINFSSLKAIQQSTIDSFQDGLVNLASLSVLLYVLNLGVSLFMTLAVFFSKRDFLATTRFLGWTFKDRYRSILSFLFVIYVAVFLVLLATNTEATVVGLVLLSFLVECLSVFVMVKHLEKQNIAQWLKGGGL